MTVLRPTAIDAAPQRGRNEAEDGRERLSWPARNANLFAGEESCVWPLRPRRSRRRRPSVTPDPSRSAWVWPAEPDRARHAERPTGEFTSIALPARSLWHHAHTPSRLRSCRSVRTPRRMMGLHYRPFDNRAHRRLDGASFCRQGLRFACDPAQPSAPTPHRLAGTEGSFGLQGLAGPACFTAEVRRRRHAFRNGRYPWPSRPYATLRRHTPFPAKL
ncbi:hypothetical protein EDE09_11359 [Neorhizobium sp. S3-V5DH]|nr:hypothetical protein EDE09_11359 [Neorhizobium sp. S3-V5DH]